jgi:hypothetical protein
MRRIAATAFGSNALVAGLTGHAAAVLAGMLPTSVTELFFIIVYLSSWAALNAGAFVELKYRGRRPARDWRCYLISAASLFPLLGPLLVLGFVYHQQEGQSGLSGLFPAMLRLRANALLVFILLIVIFLFFALIRSRHDPYFRKIRSQAVSADTVILFQVAEATDVDN